MKRLLRPLSIIVALIGLVWFGQGIGIIHGSVMTDDRKWAVIGGIMIVVAIVLFFAGRKNSAK